MKNANTCATNLASLLKKIGQTPPPPSSSDDDPLKALVMSFLMWETTSQRAAAGYEAVICQVVDLNDLRVSMPHEVAEWLGPDYPRALDRTQRLRAVLRDIYLREHAVSLDKLRRLGKREVRKYLESLEGIPPYVAARVALLCFGAHAVPVDDQLRARLIEVGAADASTELPGLAAWLTRQIRAEDSPAAHHAFQNWVEELASMPALSTGNTATDENSARETDATGGTSDPSETALTQTAGDG